MRIFTVTGIALLLAASPTAALAAPQPVTGRWLTEDGKAQVEIGTCGSTICGQIARVLVPPPAGKPTTDYKNPDPALRARPLQGLTILSGFGADGDQWTGRIYDPQSGKTYRSVLERDGAKLKVKGCIAFFCKTQTWTRAR